MSGRRKDRATVLKVSAAERGTLDLGGDVQTKPTHLKKRLDTNAQYELQTMQQMLRTVVSTIWFS